MIQLLLKLKFELLKLLVIAYIDWVRFQLLMKTKQIYVNHNIKSDNEYNPVISKQPFNHLRENDSH